MNTASLCGDAIRIVNGICQTATGRHPSGAVITPLREVVLSEATLAAALPDGNDGICLTIPAGTAAGLLCIQCGGERGECNIAILAGEESSAEIVFTAHGAGTMARTIIAARDASLKIREEFAAAEGGTLTAPCRIHIAAGAHIECVTAETGTGTASLSYHSSLEGEHGELLHSGLFMAGTGERKSFDIRVEHLVPDCHSNVLVKGVAANAGYGAFNGMVYVAQDAQHTEAYQQSRNLLLGDKARILTSPRLEIYADDVRCSHGATVGQMDDDAVYYMRQRGLSETEARGLQLAGFVNDIIMRFGDDALATRIIDTAGRKIAAMQQEA